MSGAETLQQLIQRALACVRDNDNAGAKTALLEILLSRQHREDEAIACYEQARELLATLSQFYPDDAEVWFLLGAVLGHAGRYQDAADCCRRAVALRGDYVDAHYNLGLALLGQGQSFPEAAASFRRAIQLGRQTKETFDHFRIADLAVANGRSICVSIAGNLAVQVPASLQLMTPYVLLEQEDWFEEEIRFVRKWLRPGMRVIDIGANYGVYTLTMASCVGGSGRVWAFEPASSTAAHLKRSIEINRMPQVQLTQAALSDREGQAQLAITTNSETNTLSRSTEPGARYETVTLTTLDQCAQHYGWEQIEFIKLDAEGAEEDILRGGHSLLTTRSPVVMFEIRHVNKLNLPLMERFKELGYELYHLVPGPCFLAPFSQGEPLDRFALNLFACKPDSAFALAQRGLLAQSPITPDPAVVEGAWSSWSPALPYASRYSTNRSTVDAGHNDYLRCLDYYAWGQTDQRSAAEQLGSLLVAYASAESAVTARSSVPRLLTLARIAFEAGKRKRSVAILAEILKRLANGEPLSLDEPFLSPLPRFDHIQPDAELRWLKSAVIELSVRLEHYSTYHTDTGALSRLNEHSRLGYPSLEMERRRQLIRLRFGLQEKVEATPVVVAAGPVGLNADFWSGSA